MRITLISAVVVAAGVASSASAQFTVFTDRSAWEAAVSGAITTETFNSTAPMSFADGQTLDTGLLQVTRDGSANGGDGALDILAGGAFGNIDGTNFLDAETGADPHERVEFGFNGQAVTAFGADFFSPFSGDGVGVEIDGELFLLDYITDFNTGFFGVVSTGSFDSVAVVGNPDTPSFQELWSADNVSYAAVPAPSTAALLGLGGLAAARRRR